MAVDNGMAEGIVTIPDGILRKNGDTRPGSLVSIYNGLGSALALCAWPFAELSTIYATRA